LANRWGRTALLAGIAVGWALLGLGIVLQSPPLGIAGSMLLGIGNLVLAKALFELRTSTRKLAGAARRTERSLSAVVTEIDRLHAAGNALREADATQERSLERLRSTAASFEEKAIERFRRAESRHTADAATQSAALNEMRDRLEAVSAAHEVTRSGLNATRALTDKLSDRARRDLIDSPRLRAAGRNEVESPLLSIAIPSYNRPDALAELLESIRREMVSCPDGLVEVCVTDDASTDPETIEIALSFAEEHEYLSLHVLPANIGLERNLIGAAQPCRGEFLWAIGNDDVVMPGALGTILNDLEAVGAPVLLYAKGRIKLDGTPHDPVPGTTPIELAEGGTHLFDTLIDAARHQGLLSTFGFAGQLVTHRDSFVSVDPTPYLDLTMYSRSCVTIQAFADDPVFYRNRATILHRTPTPAEKYSEALGRPEEGFMRPGVERRSRYLGTTLAAALQRLIDHGAFRVEDLIGMPENLMSPRPLLDWIADNRRIDPGMDDTLPADVVADAERLYAAVGNVAASMA
jgi:glycosyltransferase involved in cell wall biosynthesis